LLPEQKRVEGKANELSFAYGTGASEAVMSSAKYAERAPVHPTRRSGAGRNRNRQEEITRLLPVTAGAVINLMLLNRGGLGGKE